MELTIKSQRRSTNYSKNNKDDDNNNNSEIIDLAVNDSP